jgi:hypothetical protein
VRSRLNGFPDLRVDIADQFAAGDNVVTRLKWRGTHLTSGTTFRRAVAPEIRPPVYRRGTLSRKRTSSAVARTAAQRRGAAVLDPFSLGSARKWSSEPLLKQENRVVARFARALCRTRTGDPFLTMAVRPASAASVGRPKRLHRCRIRRSAEVGRSRHRSAPSVAHSLPGSERLPSASVPRSRRQARARSHGRASLTRARGYEGGCFSSTSGGQRTRPLSKRPTGKSRRIVAVRSSSSTIVPGMPARYRGLTP